MRRRFLILIGIIILAFFLRFYLLSSVPPSASLDEASIGYNAYSILETGGDEYGNKFPILLRAYDDWRPALYVYLVIPFIKLFGLNVLSVRLPSVILSVLTVIATYFLVKELFSSSKNKIFFAILSSLLLAISPWHIYISRLGHEVNAGLSFAVFGILFFLKAVNNKKSLFLILSSIFFALDLYTYQSQKVFVPLIIIVFGFVYKDFLFKMKKGALISFIFGITIIFPITLATLSPQGLIRFKGTSAFGEEAFYKESAEKILKYKNKGNFLGEVVNNRRLVPFKIFISNYISHFDFKFLFLNSGNESFKAPNVGLMYLWEFPFAVLGIVFLFKKQDKKTRLLLISWPLIAFIAPSLTTGSPHAMRAFNVLSVPQIFAAIGIVEVIDSIKKSKFKNLLNGFYMSISVAVVISLLIFYKHYFYSFPKNQSSSFQYSLMNSIRFVLNNEKSYDKIVFSNKNNLYQSYMFYLFYGKYDPFVYQKDGGTISGGYNEAHSFGIFEFRQINYNKENTGELLIGNVSELKNAGIKLNSFKNLAGEEEIVIVKN